MPLVTLLLPGDAIGVEGIGAGEVGEVAGGVLSAVGTGVAGAESGVVLAGVVWGGVLVSVNAGVLEEAACVCM